MKKETRSVGFFYFFLNAHMHTCRYNFFFFLIHTVHSTHAHSSTLVDTKSGECLENVLYPCLLTAGTVGYGSPADQMISLRQTPQ